MHRSYPNKLPAFQLCSWVGSGTVDLELACLNKKNFRWNDRFVNSSSQQFIHNQCNDPAEKINHTDSITTDAFFPNLSRKKFPVSPPFKACRPKKITKMFAKFLSKLFVWLEWTKAQTCEAAMDTGPVRRHKNSAPQRHAVGLKAAPSHATPPRTA